MRAAPKAVDGAATAATLTSRRRRTRRFTGRDPLRVGNHENVQTLCDDAVRKRMATGSDAQRPRRMTSSVSAGHFRRTRGPSPHVLMVGAAEAAPSKAGSDDFERIDRSFQTAARAKPARPDGRRRRGGALDACVLEAALRDALDASPRVGEARPGARGGAEAEPPTLAPSPFTRAPASKEVTYVV